MDRGVCDDAEEREEEEDVEKGVDLLVLRHPGHQRLDRREEARLLVLDLHRRVRPLDVPQLAQDALAEARRLDHGAHVKPDADQHGPRHHERRHDADPAHARLILRARLAVRVRVRGAREEDDVEDADDCDEDDEDVQADDGPESGVFDERVVVHAGLEQKRALEERVVS
eukprot:3286683-Rhodomonas_salina.1